VVLVGGDKDGGVLDYGCLFSFADRHPFTGEDKYLVFPLVGVGWGGTARLKLEDTHAEVRCPILIGDDLTLNYPRQLCYSFGIKIVTYLHCQPPYSSFVPIISAIQLPNIVLSSGIADKGMERGFAPLRNTLPSPLHKGRGIKGEGLINNPVLSSVG
jgi:hypothetical protein